MRNHLKEINFTSKIYINNGCQKKITFFQFVLCKSSENASHLCPNILGENDKSKLIHHIL